MQVLKSNTTLSSSFAAATAVPKADQTIDDTWIVESQNEDESETMYMDNTADGRFTKVNSLIFSNSLEEVYHGFDRDTGNEVMWRVINVERVDQSAFTKWMRELQASVGLECKFLLRNLCVERRAVGQVILITEMITRGSLGTYLAAYRSPKMGICQAWLRQILTGLDYLHARGITHGDLRCEHIGINSNSGELKICGVALVKLSDILSYGMTFHQKRDDIYQFGLLMLEVVFAQILPQGRLKRLLERLYEANRIEPQRMRSLLRHIEDYQYRSLVETCLTADDSVTPASLLAHEFFAREPGKDEVLTALVRAHRCSKSQAANAIEGKAVPSFPEISVIKNTLQHSDILAEQNLMKIVLNIFSNGKNSRVSFKYDLAKDTPLKVAEEMKVELDLPDRLIHSIQELLSGAVEDYIAGLARGIARRNESEADPTKAKLAPLRAGIHEVRQKLLKATDGHNCFISGNISPIHTASAISVETPTAMIECLRNMISTKNFLQINTSSVCISREDSYICTTALSAQNTPRDHTNNDSSRSGQEILNKSIEAKYSKQEEARGNYRHSRPTQEDIESEETCTAGRKRLPAI